jgi:hypothetical protein
MLYLSGWVVATYVPRQSFSRKQLQPQPLRFTISRISSSTAPQGSIFRAYRSADRRDEALPRHSAVKYGNQSICYREETERSFLFVEYVGDYYYRVSSLMRLLKLLGFSKMVIFEKLFFFVTQ